MNFLNLEHPLVNRQLSFPLKELKLKLHKVTKTIIKLHNESTKGKGIAEIILETTIPKQNKIAFLVSYPPNLSTINPPKSTPKVGPVIQTVEKQIKRVWSFFISRAINI